MHTGEEVTYRRRWTGSRSRESLVGYKDRVRIPRNFWNVTVFESPDSEKTAPVLSIPEGNQDRRRTED